jgi:hypothetical protein
MGLYPSTESHHTTQMSSPQSSRIFEPDRKTYVVKSADPMQRLSERMLKLKELEMIVKKYYPPDIAK